MRGSDSEAESHVVMALALHNTTPNHVLPRTIATADRAPAMETEEARTMMPCPSHLHRLMQRSLLPDDMEQLQQLLSQLAKRQSFEEVGTEFGDSPQESVKSRASKLELCHHTVSKDLKILIYPFFYIR
jgi:hypothetical protein